MHNTNVYILNDIIIILSKETERSIIPFYFLLPIHSSLSPSPTFSPSPTGVAFPTVYVPIIVVITIVLVVLVAFMGVYSWWVLCVYRVCLLCSFMCARMCVWVMYLCMHVCLCTNVYAGVCMDVCVCHFESITNDQESAIVACVQLLGPCGSEY